MRGLLARFLIPFLSLWAAYPAMAVTLLDFAESTALSDLKETPLLGLEVEMVHPSREDIILWTQEVLGGERVSAGADEKLTGTEILDLTFKFETNELEDGVTRAVNVIELVTEPLNISQIQKLDGALRHLQQKGVLGTEEKNAVSIQTNLPVEPDARNIPHVLNLLRNYFFPPHQVQIQKTLGVPAQRLNYLGEYSPGFMSKLFDPGYSPSSQELYTDFFFRQSLELLGVPDAWSLTDQEAEAKMKALGDPVVPQVVKMNSLRISSWLISLEPDHPYTQTLLKSDWIKMAPILEFRDWNNNFNPLRTARWTLGLWDASLLYGAFDFDKLITQLSTVPERFLRDLREGLSWSLEEPLVVRYFLGADTDKHREQMIPYAEFYEGTVWGFLPYESYGVRPLVLPGESVVFHRRPYHAQSLLGKYNPGLQNSYLAQALENKYVEMLFWQKYSPGTSPETLHVGTLFSSPPTAEELQAALQAKFPQGWILKGVWDLATEQDSLISHRLNLSELLTSYQNSDYDSFRLEMEKKHQGKDPEILLVELKQHPDHLGWRLSELLKNPDLLIAQEHLEIVQEFRVEALSGEVLGGGATTDRYYYQKENWNPAEFEDVFRRVDHWTQTELLDQLPPDLRVTPFSFDIALLKDGSLRMIESNPGGNSGFLAFKGKNIRALNKFLKEYPQRLQRGELNPGLTPEKQMSFLSEFFEGFGLNVPAHYPGIEFLPTQMLDPEFPQTQPDPLKWQQPQQPRPLQPVCQSLLLAV